VASARIDRQPQGASAMTDLQERVQAAPDAGAAEEVVRLDSVSKVYGTAKAVDQLSLTIRKGEILTLLGPSGCGKTSTLRMTIGLERASSGTIHQRGRVVDDPQRGRFVPSHKRDMGMVFQSYAIWPNMTVAQNVAYPLRVRKVKRDEIERRVNAVLELVGLSGFGGRGATELSGGQQQRVAIARSIVFEPDLLLLDEPFSNLDTKLREQMRGEVKVLQRRLGMTVLFVTHDQIEALSLSDRIAVMHQGRIEQLGSPEDLYRRPASALVRDFLGRIILLEGTVAERRGGEAVVTLRHGERLLAKQLRSDLAVGQRCFVAVRPEHVLLDGAGPQTESEVNRIRGHIEAKLFLGDCYEARVKLSSGESITVTLPADHPAPEGAQIRLYLPDDKVQAWPA
jgi:ABC-type Fe3+/spermidine/putrescine transport system ATPase subunit